MISDAKSTVNIRGRTAVARNVITEEKAIK